MCVCNPDRSPGWNQIAENAAPAPTGFAEIISTKCLPERERENFNHALFAFAFFSRRQDRELLGAISRGLLDCPRRV